MFRAVADEAAYDRGKERRALLGVLALLTVVSALAIFAGIYISIHDGRDTPADGPGGVHLTADEVTGRAFFAETCKACHTLAAVNAVARIGPDLDSLKPSAALVLYAIHNGFSGSSGAMPAGLYSGKDASDIASFVAAVAGR
jgi:mono/diheme cytochrome c family protein